MIPEAIVLAGGMGTRLRSVVPDLPKCLAPIAGIPFLEYLLTCYRKQGVRRFIFALGYKTKMVESFLQKIYFLPNIRSLWKPSRWEPEALSIWPARRLAGLM